MFAFCLILYVWGLCIAIREARYTQSLTYGVTATQQILVLLFEVRILVGQRSALLL